MNYDISAMNTRVKFSVVLLSLGLVLALLPQSSKRSLTVNPKRLFSLVTGENTSFTVDQVARFVVAEDSTVRIVDLRTAEEFNKMNIPGSINIPYSELLKIDPSSYLTSGSTRNILYSNGDLDANYALILARGMNFSNTFTMRGGLNEWFDTVMNSSFSGERISARENAIFEIRTRARRMFTEINSLPDSLKQKFFEDKHVAAKKLDGGCE